MFLAWAEVCSEVASGVVGLSATCMHWGHVLQPGGSSMSPVCLPACLCDGFALGRKLQLQNEPRSSTLPSPKRCSSCSARTLPPVIVAGRMP